MQKFYDDMAPRYDKLFADWDASSREQAAVLDAILRGRGFGRDARVLDCACGIGTQALGLAELGYRVTASDISASELAEAKRRAAARGLDISFRRADLRDLPGAYAERFDAVIAMDNVLPHMLTPEDLKKAVGSVTAALAPGGIFIASVRDYDSILESRPPCSPPYIHDTENCRRVSFQTWDWSGDRYSFTQYIIEDGDDLEINKYVCEYRAVRREELTELFRAFGFAAEWLFPEETGFYQPVVLAAR